MKQFLAFLAGLLGGATAGYLVTKKVYGESYERDLEDIRAYYDEEVKKLKEEKVTVEEEVKTNNKKKTTKADTDIKDAAKELSKDEERVDYSGISTEKTKKSATKTTKSKKKEPDILIIDAEYKKIVQLNRPLENQLLQQIEYLTNQLFAQLGITAGILDGTADENIRCQRLSYP